MFSNLFTLIFLAVITLVNSRPQITKALLKSYHVDTETIPYVKDDDGEPGSSVIFKNGMLEYSQSFYNGYKTILIKCPDIPDVGNPCDQIEPIQTGGYGGGGIGTPQDLAKIGGLGATAITSLIIGG